MRKHSMRLPAAVIAAACLLGGPSLVPGAAAAPLPGGTLDPLTIQKFVAPLPIPRIMPKARTTDADADSYEVAARQIEEQVLPVGMPKTTVWGYGAVGHPETFGYPSPTIEATTDRPVRVKWINGLRDREGHFLPHLFPIDQTLHWANPPQECIEGTRKTDCRGKSQDPYAGPVPLITHLHGAHVTPESDGFPEAWYLPDADNIPRGYARHGSRFGQISQAPVQPGAAVFQYRNDQRATTLWYHDHTLGMTRANVYAGLAGFYLLRGGGADLPPEALPAGKYEIPLLIQDRSFNADGSLFYAPNRAFFEGVNPKRLQIPFIPDPVRYSNMKLPQSDVSKTWAPEFFGNTMVVNGKTWPFLEVEQRRYRFRILNGSDTRVLLLAFPQQTPVTIWQIGNDGGFVPQPVPLSQLLIAGAERADVIIDFSRLPEGTVVTLRNLGPDEPFGGGVSGVDFAPADPDTTGQVMQFRVVKARGADPSTPPERLTLPTIRPLGPETNIRKVTLNEFDSSVVLVRVKDGKITLAPKFDPAIQGALFFGPTMSQLGTLGEDGMSTAFRFMDPITENPAVDATEVWELYNFTADAHPIHIHQVTFEVINRQSLATDADGLSVQPAQLLPGTERGPDQHETGLKDTVLVYPGGVTRVKMHFDIPGRFVWHCHILSHEDNEMMRPFCVGPPENCQ